MSEKGARYWRTLLLYIVTVYFGWCLYNNVNIFVCLEREERKKEDEEAQKYR